MQKVDKTGLVHVVPDGLTPELPPISLIGEHAERYIRFAKAAARLRETGDAHMKAQDEYKIALGLLSASAEKFVTADKTEPA